MGTILAIDTSAETASVALLHHGLLHWLDACSSASASHSQMILPMIQQLLQRVGVTISACDAIAFGAGPGSFTGVRTACGVAQGLAFGADLPVVPVNTLEAMALGCHQKTGANAVVSVVDARMGEVYWARYDFKPERHLVIAPTLSAPAKVIVSSSVTACGNGLLAHSAHFAEQAVLLSMLPELMPHAMQVATLASEAFTQGLYVTARDAQPIYLRNNIALTTLERQLKKQQGAL